MLSARIRLMWKEQSGAAQGWIRVAYCIKEGKLTPYLPLDNANRNVILPCKVTFMCSDGNLQVHSTMTCYGNNKTSYNKNSEVYFILMDIRYNGYETELAIQHKNL